MFNPAVQHFFPGPKSLNSDKLYVPASPGQEPTTGIGPISASLSKGLRSRDRWSAGRFWWKAMTWRERERRYPIAIVALADV